SVHVSRLASATVPVRSTAAVIASRPRVGAKETTGAVWSLGSRTLRTAVVDPVMPSASVATAAKCILPGAPAVTVAGPAVSRVTGWPSRVSVRPVMGARLPAMAWTRTAVPGVTGKPGVSSIVTPGGVAATAAWRTTLRLVEARPSLTVKVTTKSPAWAGPGVQRNTPVVGLTIAPTGRPLAE